MAIVHLDGFEHGVFSTAGTGLYDTIGGTPATETTVIPSGTGLRSFKADCASTAANLQRTISSSTIAVCQFRFMVPASMPDGYSFPLAYFGLGGGFAYFLITSTTSRELIVRLTNNTTNGDSTAFTYTEDQWHLLTAYLNVASNPWTCDWKVDGTTQGQASYAQTATSATNAELGPTAAASGLLVYYDDWVVATGASGDYPMNYFIKGYSPNAVGTHNLDASTSQYFFKDISNTETALTTSETTSYQQIDDVPINNDTDHVLLRALAGGAGGSLPVHQATVAHSGNPTTAPSATLGTTAADDVLIAVVVSGGSNTIPTLGGTYNGGAWTSVDDGTLSTTGAVAVYWSRCTGNHTGQTVTSTTVDSGSLQVSRYNSVYAGGSPIGANKSESSTTNAANPGLTAFTTTTNNSKIILAVGADDNLAAISAATATSALTLRGAPTSSGGADSGVGLLDRDAATAGTSGAFTTTWGANAAGTAKYLLGFELLGAASVTQPTNTWYLEYGLADSSESAAPTAVRGIVTLRNDSGTTANSITAKLRANSNESNIFSGDIGSASNIYKSALFLTAPGGASWTDGIFDGATIRWGYTNDADSTPRLESALLEALFVVTSGTQYNQSISATSTATASLVKQAGKSVAATSTATASFVKGAAKILTSSATGTASLVKRASKSLLATSTATASLVASRLYLKALSATSTATAVFTKRVGKLLSPTSSGSPSITKGAGKSLAATSTASPSLIKRVSKSLVASSIGTALLSKTRLSFVSLVATSTATASIVKRAAKAMTASASSSAAISRVVGKSLSATATGWATLSKAVTKSLSAGATGTAFMGKAVTKTLSATSTAVATLVTQLQAFSAAAWLLLTDRAKTSLELEDEAKTSLTLTDAPKTQEDLEDNHP